MTPLSELPVGRFVRIEAVRPMGSLVARRQRDGEVVLYWRHGIGGRSFRSRLGLLQLSGHALVSDLFDPRLSVQQAREQAQRASTQAYGSPTSATPSTLRMRRRQRPQPADYPARSLGRVLLDFAAAMDRARRPSATDIYSCLWTHVLKIAPELGIRPAHRVDAPQWALLLARPEQRGQLRTAGKLRSYLRSAYGAAGLAPPELPPLPTKAPARAPKAPAPESINTAKDVDWLGRYWRAIEPRSDLHAQVLKLHLLLGAPKLAPFLRLLNGDVAARHVSLIDARGRPGAPARPLDLPLLPAAARALAQVRGLGVYALSTTDGRTPISSASFSAWMAQAAELAPRMTPARLRAAALRVLRGAGVPDESIARLTSTGTPGVQSRPWDGRGFMDGKRRALDTLWREIRREPGPAKG